MRFPELEVGGLVEAWLIWMGWSQSSQIKFGSWVPLLSLSRILMDFLIDFPVSEPNPESFRSISTEVVHLSLLLWIIMVLEPLELEPLELIWLTRLAWLRSTSSATASDSSASSRSSGFTVPVKEYVKKPPYFNTFCQNNKIWSVWHR